MKHVKKLWALLLALVMVLALGVTAAADEPTDKMNYRVDYREYAEGGKGIKGGVFTMTGTSGNVFEATSNENGVAEFKDLSVGTYTLTQKSAPAGYEKAFCTNYKDQYATEITVEIAYGEVADAEGNEIHNGIYGVFDIDSQGSRGYQWDNAPEGYFIPPLFQSKKDMTTVEIPFTKIVKQDGNRAPGSQIFELAVTGVNTGNVQIDATVKTTGKGDYSGKIVISGTKNDVANCLNRSITVVEKDTGAANWTYSDKKYSVVASGSNWDGTGTPTLEIQQVTITNGQEEYAPVAAMTFTNIYTRNVTHTRPAQTTETKIDSPKTFDAGIGIYAVSALLSVTGGAWLVSKKRK